MNKVTFIEPDVEHPLVGFIEEHGTVLAELLKYLCDSDGSAVFDKLNQLVRKPTRESAQELNAVLDNAIATLLEFVGERIDTPATIRSSEFDAALRWYAARLTDFRNL